MKGIKAVLAFVLGGAYASTWWAAAMFLKECNGGLYALCVLATIALFMVCIGWLVENWDR